ncbi:MAG: hypothetical protein FJ318_08185 [SAR202 cluster bacterium]|nr:hypothetical protein [SAR202 cluster bacterium]
MTSQEFAFSTTNGCTNRRIDFHRENWNEHAHGKRREIIGQEAAAEETCRDPDFVVVNPHTGAIFKFRKGAVGGPWQDYYMLVIEGHRGTARAISGAPPYSSMITTRLKGA